MHFLYLLLLGAVGVTLLLHHRRLGSCLLYVVGFIIFTGCMADTVLLLLARGDKQSEGCCLLLWFYFFAHLLYCWYALHRERQKWELVQAQAEACRKAADWGVDQRCRSRVIAAIQETMHKRGHQVTENDVLRALHKADHPLVR